MVNSQRRRGSGPIDEIVIQEMGHMALACNMLTAIGGSPSIANSSFAPSYPVTGLPGNVHPTLVVDLLPLNAAALDTFIAIEKPEFTPVAQLAAQIFPTIGDFYNAILRHSRLCDRPSHRFIKSPTRVQVLSR
jgi:Ferritin-like